MKKMPKIEFSLVLPAYNEEGNIEKAVLSAQKFLTKRFSGFEIIVVNDGSSDSTSDVLKGLTSRAKSLRIVNHRVNQGYGAAVWDGLKSAQGELVFFTDSDLQFDLNDLTAFLKEIKSCDVVIGYRKKRIEGWRRKINEIGWKLLCRLMLGIRFRDIDCAFKLFRRDSLAKVKIESRGATFSAELLYKLKTKGSVIRELPVRHLPRINGRPTGSKLSVILRAFGELYRLFLKSDQIFKSRTRALGTIGIVALFLSRFLFLSNSRDFFDSSEYLWRLKIPEMIRVLTSGHPPFHPMFVGLESIFYKLGIVSHDGITAAIVPSALLGSLSIIFIYFLAKDLFGRRVAALTSVIYALLPFVYSSQLTILVDPTMHGFYFASLYVFALSLNKKGSTGLFLAAFSGLLLGAAAFTHTSIAFWAPAYLGIWVIKSEKISPQVVKKDYLKFILLGVFAMWAIGAYVYLLRAAYEMGINDGKPTIKAALKYLLLGNVSDRSEISLYLATKYYLTISTSIVALMAILGWFKTLFKSPKNALAFFIWFVPSTILTANYIYENLHGRAMMPGLFPTVLLAVLFLFSLKNKYLKTVLTLIVIIQVGYLGFLAAIKYKTRPAPFEEIYLMQKSIENGGVFISSNVTRTFNEYQGKFISFGDVGQGANEAEEAINDTLTAMKKAYVSLDAVWYPKRRFDGMYYDIRANAAGKPANLRTLLNNVFEEKRLSLVKMNNLYNQAFYEISDHIPDRYFDLEQRAREHPLIFGRVTSGSSPSSVVSVSSYQNNLCQADKWDISYGDLGFCAARLALASRDIESWTYTDVDGWFYLPVSKNPSQITLGFSAEQSRIEGQDGYFVKSGQAEIKGEKLGSYNLDELKDAARKLDSFYVVSNVSGDQVRFDLYKFDLKIEKTSRIEGEDLVSETGKKKEEKTASGGAIISSGGSSSGYLVSGPYISLDPGKYEIKLHYSSNRDGGQTTFDVISQFGKNELNKIVVKNTDMKKEFSDQTLEFEVPSIDKGQNIEFRVKTEDASLDLDYINLRKM